MLTEITFRHFEAVPELRDHVRKAIEKLNRFYDGITTAHVVLDIAHVEKKQKTVEISLGVYRQTLTASGMAETHEEAVNLCVAHLRRQVLRYKDKLRSVDKDVHR